MAQAPIGQAAFHKALVLPVAPRGSCSRLRGAGLRLRRKTLVDVGLRPNAGRRREPLPIVVPPAAAPPPVQQGAPLNVGKRLRKLIGTAVIIGFVCLAFRSFMAGDFFSACGSLLLAFVNAYSRFSGM